MAGIAFCDSFACGVGADDGATYEDDDAVSAGALLGGGGFGSVDLGSCPCPAAALREASAARWAPSLSPMLLKTASVTSGSRFGAMDCFHPNLPRCASCSLLYIYVPIYICTYIYMCTYICTYIYSLFIIYIYNIISD